MPVAAQYVRPDATVLGRLPDGVTREITPARIRDAVATALSKGFSVSVEQYGAANDGLPHKVSDWLIGGALDRGYANLAAIQADHPHALSLLDDLNYVAIQSAMNAVQAQGGGAVFFPAGAGYVLTQSTVNGADNQGVEFSGRRLQLTAVDGVSLMGEGGGSVIKKADNNDYPAAPFDSSDGNIFWFIRCKNVTVHGLTFQGRATDAQSEIGYLPHPSNKVNVAGHLIHKTRGQGFDHGVAFESCQRVHVSDCRFLRFFGGAMSIRTRMGSTGFSQPAAPNDPRDSIGALDSIDYRHHSFIVSNNFFWRCENFTTTSGGVDLMVVTGNVFHEAILAGIKINTALMKVGRVQIANNIFHGGRDSCIVAHSYENLEICDNHFYECRGKGINDPLTYNAGASMPDSEDARVLQIMTNNELGNALYSFPYKRDNVAVERNTFVKCGRPMNIANGPYVARKDYIISSTNSLSVSPDRGQSRTTAGAFVLNGGLAGSHKAPTKSVLTQAPYVRLPIPAKVVLHCWGDNSARTFTIKGYAAGSDVLTTETLAGAAGSSGSSAASVSANKYEYITEISVDGATAGTISASPQVPPVYPHANLIVRGNKDLQPYPEGFSRLKITGAFHEVLVDGNYFDQRIDRAAAIQCTPRGLVEHGDPASTSNILPELWQVTNNTDMGCAYVSGAQDLDAIATSQTPAAGGVQLLTINGAFFRTAVGGAVLPIKPGVQVAITSSGNDSGRSFVVTGWDIYGFEFSETLAGPNAGTVKTTKFFSMVKSVSVDANTAGAITVGIDNVDQRSAMVEFNSYEYEANTFDVAPTSAKSNRRLGTLILRRNHCYQATDRFGSSVFQVPKANYGSGDVHIFAMVDTDATIYPA